MIIIIILELLVQSYAKSVKNLSEQKSPFTFEFSDFYLGRQQDMRDTMAMESRQVRKSIKSEINTKYS